VQHELTERLQLLLQNREVPTKEVHPHEAVAAEVTAAVVHHQAEVTHQAVQEARELQGHHRLLPHHQAGEDS
jgi:hypothetical protein